MRTQDIESGAVYKVRTQYGVKVKAKVLEAGLSRRRMYSEARRDGVSVELLENVERHGSYMHTKGEVVSIASRDVLALWSEADDEAECRRVAQQERRDAMRERLALFGVEDLSERQRRSREQGIGRALTEPQVAAVMLKIQQAEVPYDVLDRMLARMLTEGEAGLVARALREYVEAGGDAEEYTDDDCYALAMRLEAPLPEPPARDPIRPAKRRAA